MIDTQTFRLAHYDVMCSAQVCVNGMFRAVVMVSRNIWPSRPRTIAMRRDRHPTAQVAIESAHAQALEWVRDFG